MPYQNPKTCRFYCDNNLFIDAMGFETITGTPAIKRPYFNLYPGSNQSTFSVPSGNWAYHDNDTGGLFGGYGVPGLKFNYIFLLGHNIHSQLVNYSSATFEYKFYGGSIGLERSVNGENWSIPPYDGWTLHIYDALKPAHTYYLSAYDQYAPTISISSVSMGRYYDMPHSVDLNKLSMTRQMDGVRSVRTKGGNDLTDHRYTKSPMWGNAGAWELHSGASTNQALSRPGRRVWDLNFSYLQDSSVFPEISNLNWFETGYTETTAGDKKLLDDDNFYSQVIHKTAGAGNLPFIFQPDNNDFTNFAICKFDMNSFKYSQQSPNLYRISLKIREIW